MKKSIFAFILVLLISTSLATAAGFDQFGYNRTARVFVGTYTEWCLGKYGPGAYCNSVSQSIWANDQIVMKWNKEWDLGNAENWLNPPYDAWEDNEWNGAYPDGSGEVWHYKIKWVGACGDDGTVLSDGGYCIWGQFEVLMDQGTSGGEHFWNTHAIPNGYGVPNP